MKKIFSIAVLLMAISYLQAQLTASADTAICWGQSVQLIATGGSSYTWSPTAGLNAPNSSSPVATPAVTTTYVVSSPVSNVNIAVNGDFELGNTGFTSSYNYHTPPNTVGNGQYWVGNNAPSFSSGMVNCPDHTNNGGSRNMLIADGITTGNTPVWCQTLPVNPNFTYTLSGWIQTLNQTNLPKAKWMVNGVPVGNTVNTVISCVWTRFMTTWNSGSNTVATFCVYDVDSNANGNDFAMDDFTITANGVLTDTVIVSLLSPPAINLGNDTSVCVSQQVFLDAGNSPTAYEWSDGSSNQTITVDTSGTFSVTVTGANGCTANDAVQVSQYNVGLVPLVTHTSCGLNNGMATVMATNGFGPYTYLWSNSSSNDSIFNLAPGNYSVVVRDSRNCADSIATTINTSGNDTIFIAAAVSKICASDSAEICAPDGYLAYNWSTGELSKCIYAKAAGAYYLTVTDIGNCTVASNRVNISTFSLPSVAISVKGDTLSAFNAISYQWYLNGSEIPGAISNYYVARQSGNYSVLIADTNGCYASSNSIPVATAIDYLESGLAFNAYPNPLGEGMWVIESDKNMLGGRLYLYNIEGRLVYSEVINESKSTRYLPVTAGVYLAKFINGSRSYYVKLVKL